MLTRLYVEALLADEDLGDQVRELWDAGEMTYLAAMRAWWFIALAIEMTKDQPSL